MLKTKVKEKHARGQAVVPDRDVSDLKAQLPFASNLGELLGHLLAKSTLSKRDSFVERLCQELSRYTGLPRNYIYPVSGALTIHELVCRSFVPAGHSIVMPGPTETPLTDIAAKLNIEIIESFGESPFEIDTERLAGSVTSKTSLVYLTNPSRPAGAELSTRDLEILLNQKGDFIVALDESEYELARMDSMPFLEKYNNLLIIRTFPRLMGLASTPGGYVLTRPSNLKLLQAAGQLLPDSELSKAAAIAALRSVHYLQNDDITRRDFMTLLIVRLRGLGIACRITPFDYILVESCRPEKLTAYLLGQGVSCRSLSHLRQLENMVAIYLSSDTAATATIEVIRRAPRELLSKADNYQLLNEFLTN